MFTKAEKAAGCGGEKNTDYIEGTNFPGLQVNPLKAFVYRKRKNL